MKLIGNFINQEDLKTVQEYITTIKFNTREDHDPLHDALFDNEGTKFDIHTRGEMPDHILQIFSKYSKGFYEAVQSESELDYHPPMFSKHYIARYRNGGESEPHFNMEKPAHTFGSYIVWQNAKSGGHILFPNREIDMIATPGDLIIFEESEQDKHGISKIENGEMFISEAWMGVKGQLWMPNRTPYEKVEWNDWEIKGFYD